MLLKCPKCGQECEGEAPKKEWWFVFDCENCGLEFNYDSYREEYYDEKGNELLKGER